MSKGLYLADGSFKSFDAESLTAEIATRANAGGLLDGSYGGFLNLLPDPDPVLRKRCDEAAVLEDLAADDHVTAAMLGRKERVLKRDDYSITPGALEDEEPTEMAGLLADRLAADLEQTTLHDIVAEILDAPFFGMVPLEIMWEPDGNWWHIKDIIPRPYHWFAYNYKNELVFKGENSLTAEPLPAGKFVVARHHPSFANPYGLRLLSRCLWPVAFKRGGIQFYVRFIEKFGIPHTIAKAPSKANAMEKSKMAADLANIVANAVAVLPCGSDVQFETVSGQTGDLHETFLKRWDKAISKVLSGQTLTLEMEGSNSLAASETHAGVADDISHADIRIVTTALNEICWLYTRINAGENELCPVFGYKEIEDLHRRVELDAKLHSIGVRFAPEHFVSVYKMKEGQFTLAADQPSAVGLGVESPSFSAPNAAPVASGGTKQEAGQPNPAPLAVDAQLNFDEIVKETLPELVKANQRFVTELENAVSEAASFEELEYVLATMLQGRTEPEQFEAVLQRLMMSAAVYGADTVEAEVEQDA